MLAAFATLLLTGPGDIPAVLEKGIQDGWALTDELKPILTDDVARQWRENGVVYVRLHFRLNAKHPTWDETLLRAYEGVVKTVDQRGMSILGLVTYESHPGTQADWIANSAEVHGGDGDNPYFRAWATKTFRTLLKRFPKVQQWEVWNEPNCWTTHAPGDKEKLPGGFYLYPSNFAQLLRHARAEADCARRTIVAGGLLAGEFTDDEEANLGLPYLRDVKRRLTTASEPHAWGFHPYLNRGGTVPADYLERSLTAFYKAAGRPVWLTEFGWDPKPGGLTESQQAANVATMYRLLDQLHGFGPAFYFKWRDEPAAGLSFGLVRADGTPKPALQAYRKAPAKLK